MGGDASGTETDERRILLVSDQTRDGLVRVALGRDVSARLLYQRCYEARAQDLPGQDFARVVSAPDGSSLAFCVCDGVGSSYKGDFAARYVAKRLVDWLGGLEGIPDDTQMLTPRLARLLAQWAEEAQAELCAQTIPSDTAAMVREVLEDLRGEVGSETVFFAGRVDRAPETSAIRALCCWMGNISVYLFKSATQGVYIRPADDAARWSTGRGVRGALSMRSLAPNGLERLLVHTDGCDALSEEIPLLSDDELRERCEAALAAPTSDDITILDIRWAANADPGALERDIPIG